MRVQLVQILAALVFVQSTSVVARVCAQPQPQSPASSTAQPAAPAAKPSGKAEAPASATPVPSDAAVKADAKEVARAAYARGQAAFAEGKFEDAQREFEAAFAAVPNPVVLLGISEAQAKRGDVPGAVASLQRYLELNPTAADRPEVEAKLAELSKTPATLVVTSEPVGADIAIDGEPTQQKTPATFELSAGAHEVQVSLPSYKGGLETLVAQPGGRHELTTKLEPLAAEPAMLQATQAAGEIEELPGEVPPPALVHEKPEPPTTALWVTGSIGAAGLVTGTVLGFLALKEHSDYEANPTEASADQGERLALFADVAFGIGAMSLITAAVLYFTYDDTDVVADADSARLEIEPQVTPSSATATARVRF
jgi:tetratricopeptide (TPR) repeat protein